MMFEMVRMAACCCELSPIASVAVLRLLQLPDDKSAHPSGLWAPPTRRVVSTRSPRALHAHSC